MLNRLLRRAGRVARFAGLRSAGRLLRPALRHRGPLAGLSRGPAGVKSVSADWVDLDPEREVVYGAGPERRYTAPRTYCATIKGARVLSAAATIVSPADKLLLDVSPAVARAPWRHPDLDRAWLPRPERLEGRVAVIGSVLGFRYYHWMLEILPRLDFLRRAQASFDRLIAPTDLAFQRETLALFTPTEAIIPLGRDTHFICDELILPSLPSSFGLPTPEVCAFLRRTFLVETNQTSASKVIYVSRNDATRRRLVNEDALIGRLSGLGVETVLLEQMSVADQAALFASARLVVGPHGAGLTNIVFANAGAALLEFMPDVFENPCFEIIAGVTGVRHAALRSRSVGGDALDQTVDIDAVERAAERLLIKS